MFCPCTEHGNAGQHFLAIKENHSQFFLLFRVFRSVPLKWNFILLLALGIMNSLGGFCFIYGKLQAANSWQVRTVWREEQEEDFPLVWNTAQ